MVVIFGLSGLGIATFFWLRQSAKGKTLPGSILTRSERLTAFEDHLTKLRKHLSQPTNVRQLTPEKIETLLNDRRDADMRDCDRVTIKNQQFLRNFEANENPSRIEQQAYERLRLDP